MPSQKILAKKQQIVKDLAAELKDAKSIVVSNYQGLDVAQDTEMRRAFREAGLQYKVIKNTIALRALESIGITGMEDVLVGPTALAYSKDDIVLAPSLVKKFADQFKKTEIKGGVVEGAKSDLQSINALASIPSLEVLQGQLAFTLLFPITRFAMTLNALAKKGEEQGVDNVAALVCAKTAQPEAAAEAPAENTETTEAAPAEA